MTRPSDWGVRTKTPKEVTDKVENIVRKALGERVEGQLVFDPIIVMPSIDHCGDEYLHIYVVVDGDYKLLDPGWTLGLPDLIFQQVEEGEVPGIPDDSFIPKSEWEEDRWEEYIRELAS